MTCIAIVEDDSELSELLADILASEGYETVTCPRADAAYVLLCTEGADIILLDIRLEEPDSGWGLLEMLRSDQRTKAIPVIVCSADRNGIREKAAWLLQEGIPVMNKPFDLVELLEVSRDLLESRTGAAR